MICQSILSIAYRLYLVILQAIIRIMCLRSTDIVNGMTVTYRMVDDAVYLASWEQAGQSHVFLFNEPISIERAREMINSVGTN